MSAKPHILFYVGYDNDRGGICSFLRALSPAAAPHFEISLGMNEGARLSQPAPSPRPSLPVVEFPSIAGETISPRTLLRARTVARAAREWLRADPRRIFHGCSRAGLLVALWLARWGEQRVVATVHTYGRRRWFYRHASRTLAPGKRLFFLTPAMSRYYGLPPQAWDECLPSCFESNRINPKSVPARNSIIRATGIGAFARYKRWELILDALARLPADVRARWTFTHIGTTDGTADSERYQRELIARTRTLGLENHVRWLGQQSSSAPLLAETDVLLVASENEALSLARLEALAAGVPSISADSGAARDFITPAVTNGWLFRDGDAAELSRVFAQLSELGALEKIKIDTEILKRFSAERCAEQHAKVYEQVIAK